MAVQNMLSERQVLETKIKNARYQLLILVVFTVANVLLLITNSNSYFLFSAYIPYILIDLGMLFCGLYPAEFYDEYFAVTDCYDTSVFVVIALIATVILALYLLSWFFSRKNKPGWLVFALTIFSIDTVLMLLATGPSLDGIMDILFHIWVIGSLLIGISSCNKLKKLPPEQENRSQMESAVIEQDSSMIRMADLDVKARILLEGEALGHAIVYRRVKRVNELVIDGRVYEEYEAMVEMPHSLSARVGGHLIEVGMDSVSRSYLSVDGQTLKRKQRLY